MRKRCEACIRSEGHVPGPSRTAGLPSCGTGTPAVHGGHSGSRTRSEGRAGALCYPTALPYTSSWSGHVDSYTFEDALAPHPPRDTGFRCCPTDPAPPLLSRQGTPFPAPLPEVRPWALNCHRLPPTCPSLQTQPLRTCSLSRALPPAGAGGRPAFSLGFSCSRALAAGTERRAPGMTALTNTRAHRLLQNRPAETPGSSVLQTTAGSPHLAVPTPARRRA